MHEHLVPMRWADIDSLNHVNNVAYLAYAAEGWAAMADDGLLPTGATPSGTTVRFVRPLRLGRRPVVVAGRLDGDVLEQQVALDTDSGRRVFAEVTTTFGALEPGRPEQGVPTLPMSVRRDDLGADGRATPVKVFELFQESRVLHVSTMLPGWRPGRFVVGTSAVTFRAPVRWSDEPLRSSAWVGRVGRGSFEMRSELSVGDVLLAGSTTVLVGFDASTQTAKAFDDDERAALAGLVPA